MSRITEEPLADSWGEALVPHFPLFRSCAQSGLQNAAPMPLRAAIRQIATEAVVIVSEAVCIHIAKDFVMSLVWRAEVCVDGTDGKHRWWRGWWRRRCDLHMDGRHDAAILLRRASGAELMAEIQIAKAININITKHLWVKFIWIAHVVATWAGQWRKWRRWRRRE